MKKMLIVGGGLSGLSIGNLARKDGWYVEVHEKEKEIGGLLKDYYSEKHGCYVSPNGPRILHFSKERKSLDAMVFLKKFTNLVPFEHRVLCIGENGNFSYWPINKTYEELYNFLNPQGSMFNDFVKNYSTKMWKENVDEVIKNIEYRFKFKNTRDNLFFEGQETFLPKYGYSNMLKNMCDGIKIYINSPRTFDGIKADLKMWDKIVITSHIDEFFNKSFGEIKYEGIDFNFLELESKNNILPTPVVNINSHPDYTRITEFNQLSIIHNSKFKNKILCIEKPSRNNRLYPIQTERNLEKVKKYNEFSKKYNNLIFLGRQSECKYKDMDSAVQDAINKYREIKNE